MYKKGKNWFFALALTSPMIFFYVVYYFNYVPALIPTGFIAYDNVSYIAYAKEYLDSESFSLFYSNPLSDSGTYPKIYFQTQNIFYVLMLACGIPPGLTIVFFNIAGTFLSFRIAISIFDHLFPQSSFRKLFITFFCWGGGLLALAGFLTGLFFPLDNMEQFDKLFFIDPGSGWWGLNFGRGHFMSSEGYYHFLFLAGILCVLKKKWTMALVVSFILSLSHPFTGIEYLLIIAVYSFIERFVASNKAMPYNFIIGNLAILVFHLFYYLFFLNQFPEHQSVSEQYALNWRLRFFNMIPAYCLTGGLAALSAYQLRKSFLHQPHYRLLLCWFITAFLLANHEIFIKPMQPLHFTRGYIWTSLFLLGLPALHILFNDWREKRKLLIIVLFSITFLSDNFLWLINNFRTKATTPSTAYISHEQKNILNILMKSSSNKTLVIGRDEVVPYLATVFTKAYPWISHPFTTPFAEKKIRAYKNFLNNNTIDTAWKKRDVIFVLRKDDQDEWQRSLQMPLATTKLADTEHYIVLKTMIAD